MARRHDASANLVFAWLRDPRFAPSEATAEEQVAFLPVEVVAEGREGREGRCDGSAPVFAGEGLIELELAGGHRLRVVGSYDPEALARLIRGLGS